MVWFVLLSLMDSFLKFFPKPITKLSQTNKTIITLLSLNYYYIILIRNIPLKDLYLP